MNFNDHYTLCNGVKIPAIGFGTWPIPNGEETYNAVTFALKNGYRLIDTAPDYGNEESVGRSVRDSGIDRREIFLVSKLSDYIKDFQRTLTSFDKTMNNIGLDYLDLYIIHGPRPWGIKDDDFTRENINVWKAMEAIYDSGRCRAIGVSNFQISDLKAIINNCTIIPMVNQISFYIGNTQDERIRFCQDNGIFIIGYMPMAKGEILDNKNIKAIAKTYRKTIPQICIRYVMQKGIVPLTKSVHPDFILQNRDIDFEIADSDMIFLDSLKNTKKVGLLKTIRVKLLKIVKYSFRSIIGEKNYSYLKSRNKTLLRN